MFILRSDLEVHGMENVKAMLTLNSIYANFDWNGAIDLCSMLYVYLGRGSQRTLESLKHEI